MTVYIVRYIRNGVNHFKVFRSQDNARAFMLKMTPAQLYTSDLE